MHSTNTRAPVYLRGSIYWARVRDKDGRIRRVSTHCRTHRAAVEAWRRLELAGVAHTDQNASESLAAALDARIVERRSVGRAPGTLAMYGIKARQLCRVLGATTPIETIDAIAVDHYVATRLAEGVARGTVYKELVVLRGALKLARRRGKSVRDVAEVMPVDFSVDYKPRERALTFREIDALLEQLPTHRRALVAFLLATGATYPSEVESVTRADVDLSRWTVRLRGTKRRTRDRTVPVVDFARPWLLLAVSHVPFTRWSNVRRDLHTACRAAGIAPVCPTDFRRTLATLLRRAGVEPSLIGRLLGHADSRMAERVYGRLGSDALGALLSQRLGTDSTQFGQKTPKTA